MDVSGRTLESVYLPPFEADVQAGAVTLMAAHHTLNNVLCHCNAFLLTEVLRKRWEIGGFTVSDWMDIERLHNLNRVAESPEDVYRMALEAGSVGDLRILVTGPNADKQTILSDWCLEQPAEHISLIIDGIRDQAPDCRTIEFAPVKSVRHAEENEIKAVETFYRTIIMRPASIFIHTLMPKTDRVFRSGTDFLIRTLTTTVLRCRTISEQKMTFR